MLLEHRPLTIAIAVGKVARSGKLRLLYKFMLSINEFRHALLFMTSVNEQTELDCEGVK